MREVDKNPRRGTENQRSVCVEGRVEGSRDRRAEMGEGKWKFSFRVLEK